MLRIWGRTNSTNVQKVLWCCAELGLEYERTEAGGPFGVVDTPEYRTMNPNGLVPTIDDDGFVLWESNVVVRYLCMREGSPLIPADLKARIRAEQWMEWQGTTLWPRFRNAFMGLVRTPPEKQDKDAIERSQHATAQALQGLETHLGDHGFVAGQQFSMGDIPLGVSVHKLFALGIDRADFPQVARWFDHLVERDAYREQVMLPIT